MVVAVVALRREYNMHAKSAAPPLRLLHSPSFSVCGGRSVVLKPEQRLKLAIKLPIQRFFLLLLTSMAILRKICYPHFVLGIPLSIGWLPNPGAYPGELFSARRWGG